MTEIINGRNNINTMTTAKNDLDSIALIFPLGTITTFINKGLWVTLKLMFKYKWCAFGCWLLSPFILKMISDHYSLFDFLNDIDGYLWYMLLLFSWITIPILYGLIGSFFLAFFGKNKSTRIEWLLCYYFFCGILIVGAWISNSYFILNMGGEPLWIFLYMGLVVFVYFSYCEKLTPYANVVSFGTAVLVLFTLIQANYPFKTKYVPSYKIAYTSCYSVKGSRGSVRNESIRSCNVTFNADGKKIVFKNQFIPRYHNGIYIKYAFVTQYSF
ncbi:hypothetical protein KO495_13880 [Colwellia sp. D2M02]|uniref:hypothetical protein n=1 Tax=Colwellia sp. D2M02 TaxID=2841562 RepID=UPI001C0A3599|nr:hypothetical protein [Colwellia sp. D2M02]MBU2894399.1 hypothetical protein [Colwellia sp. D2M02]